MDAHREPVVQGLMSSPKYLPTWYQYDEIGSRLFEEAAYANPFYYIYTSEWPVLKQFKNEMTATLRSPCSYMDLGCGSARKSRVFIDNILEKQDQLAFYPVDISEKTLTDASENTVKEYGRRVHVCPINGDFTSGFETLRENDDQTLITCLGGTLQILPYEDQITFLRNLSNAMSDDDMFVLTMDTTNDTDAVLKAYLGADGCGGFVQVYRNMFNRLNREFGTDFSPDKFEFEGRFTLQEERASFLTIYARSRIRQIHTSPKLKETFVFEEGEYIRLSSSESISYKYTHAQIMTLAEKGGMAVQRMWSSENGHVTCVLLKRGNDE